MRIFVAGQKTFGADVFRLCLRLGHQVVGVSAPATSHTGPGGHDRLRAAAELAGVPWMEAGTLRADSLPAGVDLLVAAHSHDFIGRKTRLRCRLGAIGYHPSLLPLHRGRDAVRWTLHMRDRVAGGSVFWLDETVDGGPIAAQDWCFVRPGDGPRTLWTRDLAPMGLRLVDRVLGDVSRGVAVAVPQDDALATWEPSYTRPPLRRPDLTLLGDGRPSPLQVVRDPAALHG